LLIDEAYIHFGGEAVLHDINTVPNLFVVRTFSKVYGLASLRIGVLAGSPENMAYVRKVSSPYNINGIALRCLPVALDDKQYVENYVAEILAGRDRLEQALKRLQMPYWHSHANFILMYIGDQHKDFVQAMRKRGILVRDRSADPGCLGCVRITVGDAAQMDRALTALEEALAEIQWSAQPHSGATLTEA
jgi:histidinol-phosphate aminotransferase